MDVEIPNVEELMCAFCEHSSSVMLCIIVLRRCMPSRLDGRCFCILSVTLPYRNVPRISKYA